jgi:hypothetical protein
MLALDVPAHQFVTDAELVDELKRRDVPVKIGRAAVAIWVRQPGFPPKLPLMGGRRSLPAVLAWIERIYGLPRQEDL